MKKITFFVLLLSMSCSVITPSTEEEFNLKEIEKELSGINLNDTLFFNQSVIQGKEFSSTVFYKGEDKLINEIDIHIQSQYDSLFPFLTNYYNKRFNSLKKDSIFNTWQTDSSEFILYKNSDSSILVNIFKRK